MKNGLTKFFWIVLLLISNNAVSRTITGKVIDASTKEPLVYVSIGIVGTGIGTITNTQGAYSLGIPSNSENLIVRFSIIGYETQEFGVKELLMDKIEMVSTPILLEAVTITPNHFRQKKIGTISESKKMVTGWGGFGKGGERGIKIKLKSETYLNYLHFYIASTSYDSILLRLHIRNIVEGLPTEELLRQEILIPVNVKSGWVDVDLEKYNLVFEKSIALTLEWVEAWGESEGNLHFSWNMFKGVLYGKEASESSWIDKKGSAGIYLDVLTAK